MKIKFSLLLTSMVAVFAVLRFVDGATVKDLAGVIVLAIFATLARLMSGASDVEGLVNLGKLNWQASLTWLALMLMVLGFISWGIYDGRLPVKLAAPALIQAVIIFTAFLIAGVWLKGVFRSIFCKFREKK